MKKLILIPLLFLSIKCMALESKSLLNPDLKANVSALNTEITNRTNGDSTIGVTTGTLRTDLNSNVSAIGITTGTLRSDLNTEITNRANGDSTIGITTGTLRTDLGTETTNRQNADSDIGITTGTLRTDLGTETTNRQNGDSDIGVTTGTLRTDLNSNISAIGVTTGTLRTDLTTETSNRTTGDNNIGVSTGNIVTSLADYSQIAATETYTAQKTYSNMLTVSSTVYVNGNLGIGTVNPLKKAHILGAASGVTPYADTYLFIENADGGGIELAVPSGGSSYIRFSTPTFVGGFLGYLTGVSPAKMYFGAGGATQMTLSDAGDLYINNNMSALTITDRTISPKNMGDATKIILSHKNKLNSSEVDDEKLDPLVRVEKSEEKYDPITKSTKTVVSYGRNLSMLNSALTMKCQDHEARIIELENVIADLLYRMNVWEK